jgi:redox-sensitive bicupin YhaK (pirin superfamily)
MHQKSVLALHPAVRDDIGDLVTRRPLPGPGLQQVDPFLFLNHHGPQTYPPGNQGLPFGPHPHRGFETVTFVLEGDISHKDSAGHESIVAAGGVQWMTAGRGIVHTEVSSADFKRRGGPMEVLQLWVNLAARLKMTEPRYVGLQRDAIPAIPTEDGLGVVSVISGGCNGHVGPIESLTGIVMTTVELRSGGRVAFDALIGRSIFLYVARGAVTVNGRSAQAFNLVEMSLEGAVVEIVATTDAVVLFGHGDPIGEPVVAYGPFVMNTEDEIRQAIRDYQAGRLGGAPA